MQVILTFPKVIHRMGKIFVFYVDNLLKTCDNGRIMHDGVRTVILGKTNAGKSSLLNVLAREERAIVTDI